MQRLTDLLWEHLDSIHDLIHVAYERYSESVYETIESLQEDASD